MRHYTSRSWSTHRLKRSPRRLSSEGCSAGSTFGRLGTPNPTPSSWCNNCNMVLPHDPDARTHAQTKVHLDARARSSATICTTSQTVPATVRTSAPTAQPARLPVRKHARHHARTQARTHASSHARTHSSSHALAYANLNGRTQPSTHKPTAHPARGSRCARTCRCAGGSGL